MEGIISKYVAKYSLFLLVLLAATANASMQAQVARANQTPFRVVDFILSVIVSSFAGVLFYYGAVSLELSQPQTILATLCGAGLGTRGINAVLDRIIQVVSHGRA